MKTNSFARMSALLFAAGSLLILASVADAQQAYTSHRTSLRAGPDSGYPQVAWIGAGAVVYINGCVRGYHWCDVTAGSSRGWANARHLSYLHQNRRVAIYGNGAMYGFPMVGFALGSYWDNHYRGHSWYNNRPYWNSWRPGHPHPRTEAHALRPHYAPPQAFHPQHPTHPRHAQHPQHPHHPQRAEMQSARQHPRALHERGGQQMMGPSR